VLAPVGPEFFLHQTPFAGPILAFRYRPIPTSNGRTLMHVVKSEYGQRTLHKHSAEVQAQMISSTLPKAAPEAVFEAFNRGGEAVGVSRTWYRRLESGEKARASMKLLGRLANTVGFTSEERTTPFLLAIPELRHGEPAS